MTGAAKLMVLLGAALLLTGGLLWGLSALGLGRLPGDFTWRGKNGTFHFPLASSLLISLILTLILNFWLGRQR